VQQLRGRGAHPRSLTGGKDDDDRRGHGQDRRGLGAIGAGDSLDVA